MSDISGTLASARKQVEEQETHGSAAKSFMSPTVTSRARDVLDLSNSDNNKPDSLMASLIETNPQSKNIMLRCPPAVNRSVSPRQRREEQQQGAAAAGSSKPVLPYCLRPHDGQLSSTARSSIHPAFHPAPFAPTLAVHDRHELYRDNGRPWKPLPGEARAMQRRVESQNKRRTASEQAQYLARLATPRKKLKPVDEGDAEANDKDCVEHQHDAQYFIDEAHGRKHTPRGGKKKKATAAAAAASEQQQPVPEPAQQQKQKSEKATLGAALPLVPSPPKQPKQAKQPQAVDDQDANEKKQVEQLRSNSSSNYSDDFSDDENQANDQQQQVSSAAPSSTVESQLLEDEERMARNLVEEEEAAGAGALRRLLRVIPDWQQNSQRRAEEDSSSSDNEHIVVQEEQDDDDDGGGGVGVAVEGSQLLEDEERVARSSLEEEEAAGSGALRRLLRVIPDSQLNSQQRRREEGEESSDDEQLQQQQQQDDVPSAVEGSAGGGKKPEADSLMAHGILSDLSSVNEYLAVAERNRVTPAELRLLMSKLSDTELANHWFAVVGGHDKQQQQQQQRAADGKEGEEEEDLTLIIRKWIHGDKQQGLGAGTEEEHHRLMDRNKRVGVAIMSDCSGLSKLSKTRPLLEVIRLIHEPKMVIAAYALGGLRGEAVGNWVADNSASFIPLALPSSSSAAAASGDDSDEERGKRVVDSVLRTMLVVQQEIERNCTVQVGMAAHFGTFYQVGATLQGHEAEHVELLAEDYCAAKELAVTDATAKKFFGHGSRSSPHYSVEKRADDEMDGWRVVPKFLPGDWENSVSTDDEKLQFEVLPASVRAEMEAQGLKKEQPEQKQPEFDPNASTRSNMSSSFLANGDDIEDETIEDETNESDNSGNSKRKRKIVDDIYNYDGLVKFPAGFGDRFFDFVTKHNAENIVAAASEVNDLVRSGIWMLVKVRSVEHDLLLDQLTQRMYVREEMQIAVKKANEKERARREKLGLGSGRKPVVELIKSDGNIAILVATTLSGAIAFSRAIFRRMEELGASFACSVGAWQGSAFVFDLGSGFKDVSGAPVNVSSKLAEDFGEDGIFFGRDIMMPNSSDEDGDDAAASKDEDKAERQIDLEQLRPSLVGEKNGGFDLGAVVDGDNRFVKATPCDIEKSGVQIRALKITTVPLPVSLQA